MSCPGMPGISMKSKKRCKMSPVYYVIGKFDSCGQALRLLFPLLCPLLSCYIAT